MSIMRPVVRRACALPLSPKFYGSNPHRRTHTIISGSAATSSSFTSPHTTFQPLTVPHLSAPTLEHSKEQDHARRIDVELRKHGILKISLKFADPDSRYLEQLVVSLNRHCGHQLPISHSATRGWFWDVKPETSQFQTANHQARSETMEDFPWHTDCSYEELVPRYFALQVIQHDRYGGGTLSAMNIQRLNNCLSPSTQASLMRPEYGINIPKEFIKDSMTKQIVGNLMSIDPESQSCLMRFRRDIVTPLTQGASDALKELDAYLRPTESALDSRSAMSTVHLTSTDFPSGSIIMMDNRRWLHARNNIKDPKRHLRRLRWDAVPFPV